MTEVNDAPSINDGIDAHGGFDAHGGTSMTFPTQARYLVRHETHYEYASLASLSQQLLHLRPRSFQFQEVEQHNIHLSPFPSEQNSTLDFFGNHHQYLAIDEPHKDLHVIAESTLLLLARPGTELIPASIPWEDLQALLRKIGNPIRLEPLKFLYGSPNVSLSDELADYGRQCFTPGRSVLASALALTELIHQDFTFDPEATDTTTPLSEVMLLRRGVCQDFAHMMIGAIRSLGLPCRYVSGYILTHPAPGQPRLIGADASHAWVSVFCPSIGWVDFDPTNRCMVNLEHITLGWGRDYSDVSPLRGVLLGGGTQKLEVSVTVSPLLI